MAKRNLFWHIGPLDPASTVLPQALGLLDADDVHTVPELEARDADLDLRRAHKSAGLRRKDVEGAWSRLESKIWHTKGVWLLSTPAVNLADPDQRALAMDGLRGVKVHYVLLRTPQTAARVGDLLQTWTLPLHPDRVHVVDTDGSTEGAWAALFEVAGLDSLPLPEGVPSLRSGTIAADLVQRTLGHNPGRPDVAATAAGLLLETNGDDELAAATAALGTAADRLAAAERRIAELEEDNERLDRKRRKHKRRLRAIRGELDEAS